MSTVCLAAIVVLGKVLSRSLGERQMFLSKMNSGVQLNKDRMFLKERVFSWSPIRRKSPPEKDFPMLKSVRGQK